MTQGTVNRALAELLEALKNYNAALANAGQQGNKLVRTLAQTIEKEFEGQEYRTEARMEKVADQEMKHGEQRA